MIFQFVKCLEEVDPCDNITDEDIRMAIQNAFIDEHTSICGSKYSWEAAIEQGTAMVFSNLISIEGVATLPYKRKSGFLHVVKDLHAAIKLCEPALISVDGDPWYICFGPQPEAHVYKYVWSFKWHRVELQVERSKDHFQN